MAELAAPSRLDDVRPAGLIPELARLERQIARLARQLDELEAELRSALAELARQRYESG